MRRKRVGERRGEGGEGERREGIISRYRQNHGLDWTGLDWTGEAMTIQILLEEKSIKIS